MLRQNKLGVHFIEYKRQSKVFHTVYKCSKWHYLKKKIISEFKYLVESYEMADITILFVLSQDMADDDFYTQLLQLEIRNDKNTLKPIIALGVDSLKKILNNSNLSTNPKARYLDHSRWNRYFSISEVLNSNSAFNEMLGFLLSNKSSKSVSASNKNGDFDLLKTNVALEFVELNARLLSNSRIEKFGGHADHIQPFVFHSEAEMRRKYFEKGENEKDSMLTKLKSYKLKWRILLVDDHVEENYPLSPFDTKEVENHKHLIKQNIVSNLLEKDAWKVCAPKTDDHMRYSDNFDIKIVSVKTVDIAIKKLEKETYDIVLLDFLLGYNDKDGKRKREFGHELLHKIEHNKNLSAKKNPLNYYWILIMSAFPQAFLDKLREQGLSHHSNHWHLARGADPINTPELFKYSLYHMMDLQINEVYFTKNEIAEHFKNQFVSAEKDDIREWAKSYYQIFISKFGKIHILKNDHSSLFSKTCCDYFSKNRKADMMYYEKMKNFLFLLANGSSSDSGQLQMSYMEVSKEMNWPRQENDQEKRLIHYINSMKSDNRN